jgi:membrane protease YdiL (CAAX protease family)
MVSQLRIFFILAFALTWGIGGIGLLIGTWWPDTRPLSTASPLYYLAAYSVSLLGVGLTACYDGREGLCRLMSRLIPWRSSVKWYLIVIVGYAAITGVSIVGATYFKDTVTAVPDWRTALGTLVLAIANDPGPIGEEFGWRGFALPRLLKLHSPLNASVRLGLIHAAWHLPLFFIPGMPQTQVSIPLFTIGVLAIAVFDTALYLRTGANLLLAILLHLLANVCGGYALEAGALDYFFAAEGVMAVLVVMAGGLSANRYANAMRIDESEPHR